MDITSADFEQLKKAGINFILQTPSAEGIRNVVEAVKNIQITLLNLDANKDQKSYASIKAGTTLILTMFGKFANGRMPKDYTEKDWQDIVKNVAAFSVNMDGQTYSVSVFQLYSDYINVSATLLESKGLSSKHCKAIMEISKQIQKKTELLKDGKIKETDYTEDCLWLCLEAMYKLLSASMLRITDQKENQLNELAEAASNFAFEYGRLVLYQKELALINSYFEHGKQVSEELKKQFDEFMHEVEEENKHIDGLIEQAFDPGFSNTLRNSAELAIAVGVDQNEVLKTEEDVDDFFMS